jgi:hypothetical protein
MGRIDLDGLSAMLRGMGEQMVELSKKITGADGERMNQHEKKLIRYACAPAIAEAADMLLTAHLLGNDEWKVENMDRLHDLLDL